jgi:hypothetical protein
VETDKTKTVRFLPGNKLLYSQMFCPHQGLPADITFFSIPIDDSLILRGPGYGESGDYGHGPLWLDNEQRQAAEEYLDANFIKTLS